MLRVKGYKKEKLDKELARFIMDIHLKSNCSNQYPFLLYVFLLLYQKRFNQMKLILRDRFLWGHCTYQTRKKNNEVSPDQQYIVSTITIILPYLDDYLLYTTFS